MWGQNAGEEVKMFVFVFKDMVVKLRSDDVCRMFFIGRVRYGGRVW